MAVYFIGEVQEGCCRIKIGRSTSISKRLRNLQTGNSVPLKLLGWIESRTPDGELEKSLHGQFAPSRLRGEWFEIEPADVLSVLRLAVGDGFVAKNADAFEIVGYDKDAVPEFLGVWEWGDLEIDECCPFCGCMCGMAFQEASQMYHCLNCDTLSDLNFSLEELDD